MRNEDRKMSTTCTALIIPAQLNDAVRVTTIDAKLDTLQNLVGGHIESVSRGDWHVYLNAEGHMLNLPPNLRAASLMHEVGLDLADAARGVAVFLGRTEQGYEADVPAHLIRRAEYLFGAPHAA
jgi:hypothetical protein